MSNDRLLSLDILVKTKPYLEHISNDLEISARFAAFIKHFFDFLKIFERLNFEEMFKIFKRIQCVIAIFDECQIPDPKLRWFKISGLKNHLVGERLYQDMEREIKKANDPFLESLRVNIIEMDDLKEELEELLVDVEMALKIPDASEALRQRIHLSLQILAEKEKWKIDSKSYKLNLILINGLVPVLKNFEPNIENIEEADRLWKNIFKSLLF